jgi:hypothetical protein
MGREEEDWERLHRDGGGEGVVDVRRAVAVRWGRVDGERSALKGEHCNAIFGVLAPSSQ